MKYTAGYPIVYSLTSLPAILEDTILGKEHKGLVLFEQTPIVSKTLFYDVVGDKFEPNEEASKRMKAFSHIQLNMAATIFQPPVMN